VELSVTGIVLNREINTRRAMKLIYDATFRTVDDEFTTTDELWYFPNVNFFF